MCNVAIWNLRATREIIWMWMWMWNRRFQRRFHKDFFEIFFDFVHLWWYKSKFTQRPLRQYSSHRRFFEICEIFDFFETFYFTQKAFWFQRRFHSRWWNLRFQKVAYILWNLRFQKKSVSINEIFYNPFGVPWIEDDKQ